MNNDQIRHEKLIDFLSQFPKYCSDNGQVRLKKRKEKITYSDINKISVSDINDAVKLMIDFLHLSNGSDKNIDLYKLLQAYLTMPECRDKINHVVSEAHSRNI